MLRKYGHIVLSPSGAQGNVKIGLSTNTPSRLSRSRGFMALKALQLAPREPPVLHAQARCGPRTWRQSPWLIGFLKLLSSIIFLRPRQAAHFLPTARPSSRMARPRHRLINGAGLMCSSGTTPPLGVIPVPSFHVPAWNPILVPAHLLLALASGSQLFAGF